MQLKAVMPKSRLDGFDAEIVKKTSSIVEDKNVYQTLFIDYHFLLTVKCYGNNEAYKEKKSLSFIFSQFTDDCNLEVEPADKNTPVMMLRHYQVLTSLEVKEIIFQGQSFAALIAKISNSRNQKSNSVTWTLSKAQ